MKRTFGTVEYEGGRVEEWSGSAVQLARAWETYAMRHGLPPALEEAPRVTGTLYLAYTALAIEEGFEVWAKSVVDVSSDVEDVPPTQPARSPEQWSSSPSP